LPLGAIKGKELLECGYKEEMHRYTVYIMKLGESTSLSIGATEFSAILDIKHLRMTQIIHVESMMVLYRFFQLLESNFPETLTQVFIVNVPWIFTLAFNFFKPILSKRTLEKVQIYGGPQKTWLPILSSKMPREAIPREYLE